MVRGGSGTDCDGGAGGREVDGRSNSDVCFSFCKNAAILDDAAAPRRGLGTVIVGSGATVLGGRAAISPMFPGRANSGGGVEPLGVESEECGCTASADGGVGPRPILAPRPRTAGGCL